MSWAPGTNTPTWDSVGFPNMLLAQKMMAVGTGPMTFILVDSILSWLRA